MGVSLNGGTPKTPQNDHFQYEDPMVVGENPHFGKPPYILCFSRIPETSTFFQCSFPP